MSLTIGVFDSGKGGMSVAEAIKRSFPRAKVEYLYDKSEMTYGDKTPDQLHKLSKPLIDRLVQEGCDVIVIACNTLTTNIIDRLRKEVSIPLIGLEPMVKPAAALSKSRKIAVCATPATLKSKRYKSLKREYAADIDVYEPDCSDWAFMIEKNDINYKKIHKQISSLIRQNVDVIVLGCTHYHWIENLISRISDKKAKVLHPEEAAIRQLKRVLSRHR